YTYLPVPSVLSLTPSSGPSSGGTVVTVLGSGFTSTTDVMFGSIGASSFTVVSDGEIRVTSPAYPSSGGAVVDVRGTTLGGPSVGGTSVISPADRFTYTPPPPSIFSVNPSAGPTAGGTYVYFSGIGFTGTTSVMFGDLPAGYFYVYSDAYMVALSPAHAAGT